jgi:RNA polymerase sigma factor (sigma-70 family)
MGSRVEDEDDWALVMAGNGRAMARVYDRHHARLRRHAASLVPAAADAEDVVAVVFLEAWRNRDRVRFVDGSLLPWLLTTATLSARNISRASRRYRGFLERFPRDPDMVGDPAEEVDTGYGHDALRRLSVRDQEVITLCVIEGLTEREAAHVLRVPPGTIKSRLHRAQARLKQQYIDPIRSARTPIQEASNER